jgi:hypothetical protein
MVPSAEAKKNCDSDVADEIRDELRDSHSISSDDKTRAENSVGRIRLVSADGANANPANLTRRLCNSFSESD